MREFDDIIRRKLESLPVEGTPDWSALQTRLEGEAFDSLLRSQLSSTSSLAGADKVVAPVLGWEALSSKLDLATEMEGEVFDRILSQKLSTAQTTLEPQTSWKVLSHRMDTLWPLRRVLVRYRVLEMAAAIALLLTFVPLLRDNPISIGGAATVSTSDAFLQLPQRSILLSTSGAEQFLTPEEIADLVYTTGNQALNSTRLINSSLSSSQTPSSASAESKAGQIIHSPFSFLKKAYDWFIKEGDSGTEMLAAHPSMKQQLPPVGATSNLGSSTAILQGQILGEREALHLESFDYRALTPLTNAGSTVPFIPVPLIKESKWEVGANAGFQAWNIRTPIDNEFDQPALKRWRGGLSFGVSANRTLGKRTALGLGLSLTPLNYDPNLPTLFDPADMNTTFTFSRSEKFEGISVNIAHIPVDFRVRLNEPHKRVSFWAFAGLSTNFTLSSSYDVERTFGPASIPESRPGGSELEEVIETELTYTGAKDFSPGIFETGGKLAGNVFFSGRLGVETAVKLNDRMSVFGSLTYNQYLPLTAGIGPNNDELSSAGLLLGARIAL